MDALTLDAQIFTALGFTPDPRITVKVSRSAKLNPTTPKGVKLADMQIFGAITLRVANLKAEQVGFSFFWNAGTDRLTHRPDTIARIRKDLENKQRWLLEKTNLEKTPEAKEAVNFKGLEIHYDQDSESYWSGRRERTRYIVYWYVKDALLRVMEEGCAESDDCYDEAQERAKRQAERARQALLEYMEDDEYAEV